MLDAIIERLEGSTQLQTALRHVMQDSDDALSSFEQLAADEPAVANQVLFSAAQSCPAPSDGLDTRTAN